MQSSTATNITMTENTQTTDPFVYQYQKNFIRSYVLGMPNRQLRKVAMYHFENSRVELADKMAELVAGDRMLFQLFSRKFPALLARKPDR